MTVQVNTCNRSKASLLQGLQTQPRAVSFYDPSMFNERWFTGADVKPGERFPVVLDHPKRTRFAEVVRKADGTWQVK